MKAVHVSTFSGIGGFDLAAEAVGWENIAHCEINPFGQRVLKHYWPAALSFSDITKIRNEEAQKIKRRAGAAPIIFSGGFPCQPFSAAGKRQGSDDDRHLWPEVIRVVGLVQPRVVVFENVFGLTSILEQACYTAMEREVVRLFSEDNDSQDVVETIERIHQRTLGIIIADLEEAGYTLPCTQSGEPIILCVPAAGVGAPHRRDRVWIVAYASSTRTRDKHRKACNQNRRTSKSGGACIRQAHRKVSPSRVNTAGADGTTPNPTGEQNKRYGQGGLHAITTGVDEQGTTPNPNNPRTDNALRSYGDGQEGKRGGQQELESGPACGDVASNSQSSHWENFPTQPPVCCGDDGFSRELDGITFSKWRNESIKAYGNAIVPQVAMELFKAINETL